MHRSFEDDLDKLRTRLIRMGSLVEEQVELSFRAFLDNNMELAKLIRDRDDKVDKLDIKIDKQCQKIFALQQPVARDLRLLLSALKINNELERIGDVAVGISSMILDGYPMADLAKEFNLDTMTSATYRMVKASLDAFVNNDPDLARHILPSDGKIDEMERSISADVVLAMKENPSLIERGVRFLEVLSKVERMADHATNIAECVIFLIEARMVRHLSVDEILNQTGEVHYEADNDTFSDDGL